MTNGQKLQQRINEATNLVFRFGPIDGGHHKDWVLQQAIQTINGWTDEELANWLKDWERGIAP